ncbi:uncharacterized protein LOC124438170 [Xenia sp. Carnegie-2017]|uniref:uncharacterized protein LOC124438170 n=1 Tax=Xenia sp. Carnegie-2017 TaxID=2897299 RepID=UPI001F03415E|nr:uncharacterized protein LOC124438170 [Xenia sp. Carnegie-2017]
MTSRSMASHDNRSRNMMPSDSVRNYTNMGYSQYGDDVFSVGHQQPVVVVRTFDHPGKSYYYRRKRSLPRNHSRLNYKKSFKSSTTRRRKPLPSAWTINLRNSPPRHENYEDVHSYYLPPRRKAKYQGSTRTRDYMNHEMKVDEAKNHGSGDSKRYIVENRPKLSHAKNAKTSTYYKISGGLQLSSHSDTSEVDYKSSPILHDQIKNQNFQAIYSDKKWEEKSHDPEILSIVSGSEFSEFLPTPPRPSDSQSDISTDGYSRGSYKSFKNKLERNVKENREVVVEDRSQSDHEKHNESFEETLERLRYGETRERNGNESRKNVGSFNKETSSSSWTHNDSGFRKKHHVPINGVQVLPPELIFIQFESSDEEKEN